MFLGGVAPSSLRDYIEFDTMKNGPFLEGSFSSGTYALGPLPEDIVLLLVGLDKRLKGVKKFHASTKFQPRVGALERN